MCLLNDQLILCENVFFLLFFIILNEILTPGTKAPIESVWKRVKCRTPCFCFGCVPFDQNLIFISIPTNKVFQLF